MVPTNGYIKSQKNLYNKLVLNLPEGNDCLILQIKSRYLKRFKKILKWVLLSLLFLVLAVYIFIQTPFGQNWIAGIVTKKLSKELHTKITIKHVDFSLLNRMYLEGIMIEDQQGDTLLYAGQAKVRITDWFIFKKRAELKYIGLSDAVIKFQRKDSVWSQQFLFDYFSSPSTGKKKKGGIAFNLQKVELRNVTFLKKDAWLGEDLSARVALLYLDAKNIPFTGNNFSISSLYTRDPVIALRSYTKLKPPSTSQIDDPDPDQIPTWNLGNMVFSIDKLKIVNGTFKTDKETDRDPFEYFDGKHIFVTGIEGEFYNSRLAGDSIISHINLAAKERSGFELKKLAADFRMTPQIMSFENMDLRTNNSTIQRSYSMSYHDMKDFGDYIHSIKMSADFVDSYIDSDDIAYFAPALSKWKKEIHLKGIVRGTVDEMVGRDMSILAGSNTMLNGDITLTGLPDINLTFIDFTTKDFRTTYGDAVTFFPSLKKMTSPDLKKIQYLNFKGNFTGFIRDFVTFGTIQTNLGTVRSDLNMKLPVGQEPAYSGNISTENFNLGTFFDNNKIGYISMKGTVKGRGFSDKTRNTLLDGTIKFIDYNNYRYQNITLKGTLNKKLFEGLASLSDPNAELTMNGIIDFNNVKPRFDLKANVGYANLRSLKIVKDSIRFSGKLNFDFTSSSIDDFTGTAKIIDAEITNNGKRIPFDSLIVTSSENGDGRIFTAASNEFTASLNGQFSLVDLPNGITHILNKYYPSFIRAPKRYPKDQAFSYDITTQYVDEYVQLIHPALSGFNFSHFSGDVNLAENTLSLTADVPQFKFRQNNFDNVMLVANGTINNLSVTGSAQNIHINDSLNVPKASFTINAHNDSSRISIISGANRNVDTANLNALVLTYEDGVKIEVDPSTFTNNGKQWTIDENGELEFRKRNPASGSLVLRSGEQKVTVKTEPSRTGGNWNDVKVELSKVNIGDFSPFFMSKNRLEGLVSGNILVEDPGGKLKINSDDIKTEFLRLDNDSLGEVKANLAYDNQTKELEIKGNTLNEENYLGFDAHIFIGDSTKAKDNIIALKARKFYLSVLERFLGDLFSDIDGFLTGDIDITGEFSNLSVTGKGRLYDAGLKVNFTQCYYKIKDTDIELTPQKIDLDGIVLTDTVTKNPIYITGGIEHESFKNMFYNLDIATRKPNTTGDANNKPVQLINTTYRDNKDFYGNVKGTGSLSLLGPQSNMFMKIDAIASDKDSSYITIPPSTGRESGLADFLVERKFGREMTESDVKKGQTSIIYDVDVTANTMVNVKVVLDDLTGDEIKGRGTGTLNIRSGTTEPLSLRGRFDIEKGSYLFTFQSFFKKPFELKEGVGNYIEWTGDPYDANIKFEATYKAERVSYAPLANSLNLSSGISNARGDVYVIARLTDKLFKPAIEFSLDFPSSSVAVTDPELALVIQQMQKNANEINRQVTYLIVFNSFAPSELGENTSGSGIGFNTISGIFLNVISDQVNRILGSLLKSEKYKINLNTSFYNRNIIDPNNKTALNLGSNVNFSIGRSFFNNRFIISTGVGFDAPLQQQSNIQQTVQFLPDVTLEWLVNPSGTIRASFFYRENADYLSTNSNNVPGRAKRIGASLSYKKDFDKLSDLFKKKKKPEATTETNQEIKKEDEQKNDDPY